jgi:hypothetical protein
MNATSPQNYFLSLYQAGYRDLVPIVPPGSPVSERSALGRGLIKFAARPGRQRV